MEERNCIICKILYVPKSSGQLTCSDICRKKQEKTRKHSYYLDNKQYINGRSIQWKKENRDWYNKKVRNDRQQIRQEIIQLLGGHCANPYCIDHTAFEKNEFYSLCYQIDHVNGDGTKRRKSIKWLDKYYKQILEEIKAGSQDYQLLCPTCNWIKRFANKEGNNGLFLKS